MENISECSKSRLFFPVTGLTGKKNWYLVEKSCTGLDSKENKQIWTFPHEIAAIIIVRITWATSGHRWCCPNAQGVGVLRPCWRRCTGRRRCPCGDSGRTRSVNHPKIPSINQSIDQSTNQPINQSINRPINQSINRTINQSINSSINQSNNQSINQSNKLRGN